ncbi:MAG: aminopeptidase P family protein [Chloroflexi bacterium]|nr:aminopeptidase P family protein [Chloroflexota bacterium]
MTISRFHLQISDQEYQQRCDALRALLEQRDLSGVVLFSSDYVRYFTGFAFIPTERPIGFVMNRRGKRAMFVPRMEVEHAQANALIDRVTHYVEYPDTLHPMDRLATLLGELGISRRVGADSDGYPRIFGYRGRSLSEIGLTVSPISDDVEDQMMVKSPAEIMLIEESTRWANLALRLLQTYTAPGKTESEVTQRANAEASQAMLNAIGPIYKAQGWQREGAHAEYRGQIGRNAAIPHSLANNITFQNGDVLVGEAAAAVWGYSTELERTMIIGSASDGQKRLFDHMMALQDLAFEAIQPGARCCDVDRAVRAYYERHDMQALWRHHTGHAIGMRYHEGPFLDVGDTTEIRPGMVFTVEPGLYHPEFGGFRHSDTVVVTADGIQILTYYPRDLASLTL